MLVGSLHAVIGKLFCDRCSMAAVLSASEVSGARLCAGLFLLGFLKCKLLAKQYTGTEVG